MPVRAALSRGTGREAGAQAMRRAATSVLTAKVGVTAVLEAVATSAATGCAMDKGKM